MNYSRGDVLLLPIPFSNLESKKVRPAVVIGQISATQDLLVVPITSKLNNADFSLTKWSDAGLNVPSGIKSHIATVESRLVRKHIGKLSEQDQTTLETHLKDWLQFKEKK